LIDSPDWVKLKPGTGQKIKPPRTVRPSSVVYWFRFALGAALAALLMVLKLKGTLGVTLMVAVYIVSYLMVRYGLKYGEVELKGRHKVATLGIGTYIFTWAVVWILLYTLYPY